MSAPTVFISYSHDSPEHAERVLRLHASLSRDGCECRLDVYKDTDEDWPMWMTRQLLEVDFILCVVTETYARRFGGKEQPNAGLGVGWEAGLIRRLLYAEKLRNERVFPVLFDRPEVKNIPLELQGYDSFILDGQAGYEKVLRKVLNRPLYAEPSIGTPPELTSETAQPLFDRPTPKSDVARGRPDNVPVDISRIDKYAPAELIGREADLKILSDAWQQAADGKPKRPYILQFVALGGEGKTSLVAKWVADLAYQDWPGCDAAFAWSFYSQGTSDKTQASSDSFLKEALLFFGDVEMANSAASSFDKGRRLAQIVGERRALLILDGLEPLQYAPTSPTGAELKDQGVSALLKALAANNDGLCVVTTRYSIPDLRNFWQTTAPEIKLKSLSTKAGVALLRRLGVKGSQGEFERLVGDVKGHALTLNLLGSFLRDAHAGDIRKRDLVKLEEAAEEQGGHAFHVMDAYVESFKREGKTGQQSLSALRLLGLFDRPATADCLRALWTGDEIGGVTGPLLGISEARRNITLKRLEDAGLVTVNRNEASELVSLDAHPLLREYFATRMRKQIPGGWRAAHRRLYEHLRDTTQEGDEPALEEILQPLYQAVAHGCQAGMQKDAFNEVFYERLDRRQAYGWRSLGAFGATAGAVASFFDEPWSRVSSELAASDQAWLLNEAATSLRALGRLTEALEPMRAGMESAARHEDWRNASAGASNVGELELTLGKLAEAVDDAEQSVVYANRSTDGFTSMVARMTHAYALHQTGRSAEAETRAREAEQIHKEHQSDYPLLYSIPGSQYCDLLLTTPERATWQIVLRLRTENSKLANAAASCLAVSQRARQTLAWVAGKLRFLDEALDQLTQGRAALYSSRLTPNNHQLPVATSQIASAIDGLRRAGHKEYLARGLLTCAWLRFLKNDLIGSQTDLDEAWDIAERGPMRLHMADIHLYRARLFHNVEPYPWSKFADGTEGRGPKDDLEAAEKLINDCGYHRRDEELADAKLAILGAAG